ncbi:mycothiol synthase [Pseudactinotalea sp. HY158]|uniref:mycothiol synthase n=1 Tax=Pseudactinotalea sp. HY158 TaxID=2654547 RepID=UPI00129C98A0|nr:mycothiol synthase [Pseudactinotalea sp. HY158]QGH70551.1 mycothiol synthase [Pseudactinotalea sp. HY158]
MDPRPPTPPTPPTLHTGVPDAGAVRALAAAARQADGIDPYDEQTLLNLDSGAVTHLQLAGPTGSTGPVGYAQIDRGSAELAIHPDYRRAGCGAHLLAAVLEAGPPELAIWAHGNFPGAAALAARRGLRVTRELLYLTAELTPTVPTVSEAPTVPTVLTAPTAPEVPAGIELATFAPGTRDEADWLALNAAAFADHPEQGRLTAADLHARMAQPWFDPSLFWLARAHDTSALLGAMWVKPAVPSGPAEPDERSGQNVGGTAEIYVLGVHPEAQGRRLGTLLTRVAMAEARRRGYARMDLYVERENHPAVATYARHGFVTAQRHVQYSR